MFSDVTITYKTTRRRWFFTLALTFCFLHTVSAVLISSCPEFCECYVNKNGLQAATCTEVFWNGTSFPNIHTVTLKTPDVGIECYIPEDVGQIFPQLNFFELNNCSLTYIPSNSFRDLKSLEEVDLSHNKLKKFSPSLFASNKILRYVNLENNPLNLSSHSLLRSNSIWEINLSSCNLQKLTPNTFRGLPNLKYLTLSNNKIEMIRDKTFPDSLKKLVMANNEISAVPISELIRLKRLREIDFSGNPVNCTCALINFQDWISGQGVIFLKHIQCAEPKRYAGRTLNSLPEYEMCDAQVFKESAPSSRVATNQILSEEGYVMDQAPDDNDDLKEFIQVDQTEARNDQTAKREVEGSGEEPVEITSEKYTTTEESDDANTLQPIIVLGESELSKSSTELPEIKNPDEANVSSSDPLKKEKTENPFLGTRYIVPTLLIVAIILVFLAVYFSQHNCQTVKGWNNGSEPKTNNMTEMQEVSLLPQTDMPQVQIERFSTKYNSEANSSQMEKLMENDDFGEEITEQSVYPNGHYLDTNENVPEIVRSTARVTVIPDSVPKTPTIVRKS